MTSVAVLIDGDNLSAGHAEEVMRRARDVGTVNIARVYFDTKGDNGWGDVAGLEPRVVRCAKNAGDIELALDAMEIGLSGRAQVFVIVTSDGGLAQVAYRLRALGHNVVGLGEPKAGDRWRQACSEFHVLVPTAWFTRIDGLLREGKMTLADLGSRMGSGDEPKVCCKDLPQENWHGFLKEYPNKYVVSKDGARHYVALAGG